MRHLAIVAFCALIASTASAQSDPLVSSAVAVGSAKGSGGEYRERGQNVIRVETSVRVVDLGFARLLLTAFGEKSAYSGDHIDICVPGSQNQCLGEFPEFWGGTVGVGAQRQVGSRFDLTGSAAVGSYRTTGRNYTYASSRARAFQLDAAYRVSRHVGAVASIRHVRLQNINGSTLSIRPITVGVRIK